MPLPFPLDDVYLEHLRQQRKHQQLAHLSCLIGLARSRARNALGFAFIWAVISFVLIFCEAPRFLCGIAWGIALWEIAHNIAARGEVRQATRHRDACLAREED